MLTTESRFSSGFGIRGPMIALILSMTRIALISLMPVYMLLAAPVNASAGAAVPEPSDLALFILGLLGVIVGREVAIRYKQRDKDHDNKL